MLGTTSGKKWLGLPSNSNFRLTQLTKCMNFYKQSVCKPPGLSHKFLLIMNSAFRRFNEIDKNKLLMRVKFTTILLVTAFLQFAQASKAQRITFSQKDVSLEEVFKEIRKQSGYDFFYDVEDIKKAKRISLSAKNETIEQVLNRCFINQPFTFQLEESTVVIKEIEAKAMEAGIFQKIDVNGKITDEKRQRPTGGYR